jgi:hypothetical protein
VRNLKVFVLPHCGYKKGTMTIAFIHSFHDVLPMCSVFQTCRTTAASSRVWLLSKLVISRLSFGTHFLFDVQVCYSMWTKVLQHVKKFLYNQPKPYFSKKLLWSHFWTDFNKFDTKTFRIVYILIVYLLIMFIWVVFICS